MANVIKHKRGSGSDPVASDLVVGEVAIRTDVGKLFTKMDNGSVAEIAGGGSDIAINTLSSSSGTGGGSATFNGSAYRFTLSAPPSVSAQQLLVSINGVIQKPVAGTGQPSEGFSVDGTDIILGDAPATGSDFFILTFKSLGVSEPADNSVTSAKIVDGAIVNVDINASAAIQGTKISPDFGSQSITTLGGITGGGLTSTSNITINNDSPSVTFNDTNSENDFRLTNSHGTFVLFDNDAGATRMSCTSAGQFTFATNVDFSSGIDVTGAITGTGDMTIDTNTLHVDSSNNRVGIGTTSPARTLSIVGSTPHLQLAATGDQASGNGFELAFDGSNNYILGRENVPTVFYTNNAERMRIDSSGNVGIGTSSPGSELHVSALGASDEPTIRITSENSSIFLRTAGSSGVFPTGGGGDDGELTYIGGDFRLGIGTASKNLIFFNGSGYTERMRINSSGQVGMGTSNPVQQAGRGLHINGTDQTRIKLTNASSGATANDGFDIIQENDSEIHIINHENASIKFGTNAAERMRIDSSGRLLLGTSTQFGDGNDKLMIENGTTGGRLTFGSSAGFAEPIIGQMSAYWADNKKVAAISFFGGSDTSNKDDGTIRFATSSANNITERMRIDSSGRVLIGTTSGSDALVVDGGSDAGTITTNSTNSNGNMMTFQCSGTSKFFIGSAGSFITGNSGTTNQGIRAEGALLFAAGGHTERMRISSSGRVFIGTTSGNGILNVSGNASTNETLILNDTNNTNSHTHRISFKTGGTEVGKITSNRSATLYVTSSDYRLKENVVNISDGITRLKKLLPKRFNWINDETNTLVDGFLAHEVSDAVPEAISGTKDEVDENNEPVYQGIDQSKLVPLLVAALQEAIGRIEVLEAK